METKFDLIMIADHLEESLILLRHQMCLSINDITSLSKNIAKNHHLSLSESLEAKIKRWQTVDTPLFSKGMTSSNIFLF